jgi:tubulin epsilon
MMHSLGGGTGSGLGSYILELLHDEYPEIFRFTVSVLPSDVDDVITSPYNSLLSAHKLFEHADCVLPLENQALMDIVERARWDQCLVFSTRAPALLSLIPMRACSRPAVTGTF